MINLRSTTGWVFTLLLISQSLVAQQKRSLTHADYDGWESLSSDKITKNGAFVGYQISPQQGDGRLEIFSFKTPTKKTTIPRGTGFLFTPDDAFAVGRIVAQKDSVYALKLKKKKADDLPKDPPEILEAFFYGFFSGNDS